MAADGNKLILGVRVLIVNDDPDESYGLSLSLRSRGFRVARATNGYDAIESTHAFLPQVVVVSMELMMLGACETARRIRFQMPGLQVRIVAVFDPMNPQQAAEVAGPEFDAALPLPLAVDRLQEAILQSLASREDAGW